MLPSHLDPTQFTALHSLDLGNVLSLDGRAHPFDALTPVAMVEVPATVVTDSDPGSKPGIPPIGLPGDGTVALPSTMSPADLSGAMSAAVGSFLPQHFGARVAIGFIAVVLILIVAARLIL